MTIWILSVAVLGILGFALFAFGGFLVVLSLFQQGKAILFSGLLLQAVTLYVLFYQAPFTVDTGIRIEQKHG